MTRTSNRWTGRLGRVGAVGVAAAVFLAGCGGSDSGTAKRQAGTSTSPPAAAASATAGSVDVKQFSFMPPELVVKAGTNVTWTNQDDIFHSATSGATPGTADGKFDGPMDGRGKSASHTFDQPGRYPYYCSRHNSMTGAVVVE